MVRPLRRTTPRPGVPRPAMARRIVDLPAPLVPSSASTSPRLTSKPTSNSTCTGPYEKSMSATCRAGISVGDSCWRRCSAISSCSSATTSDRSLRMNDAPRRIRNPPTIVDGTMITITAVRGPNSSVSEPGEQRAAGRADEEDVDRPQRRAHAPQPVRHDRLQDRLHHREARSTAGSAAGCPRS